MPDEKKPTRALQFLNDLEKRVEQLEKSAHTEHTIGTEVVEELVRQVCARLGQHLTTLTQQQQPEE